MLFNRSRVAVLLAVVLVLGGLTAGASVQEDPVRLPIPGVPTQAAQVSTRPNQRAVAAHLKPASFVYEDTGSAGIQLTFDDGPSPLWTPKVLQVLAKYHVHAIFCMVGFRVREHPELVRAVADAGHTLCNHTVEHDPSIGTWSVPDIRADLVENNELITAASGGVKPVYFRSPHGDFTPRIVEVAREVGLASLGWKVTATDWADPPPPAWDIAANIHHHVRPGSIILFHDAGSPGTHAQTVAALKLVLDDFQRRHLKTAYL
ncbi:polysaccharide deacetylase family protein [Fodinicola feengrottensis]|uniref:polysaccharide deacetylase family protein n=1 Tax=Fodinicola feengrottensis TaxID=435914 RepID=UPI0031D9F3DE